MASVEVVMGGMVGGCDGGLPYVAILAQGPPKMSSERTIYPQRS